MKRLAFFCLLSIITPWCFTAEDHEDAPKEYDQSVIIPSAEEDSVISSADDVQQQAKMSAAIRKLFKKVLNKDIQVMSEKGRFLRGVGGTFFLLLGVMCLCVALELFQVSDGDMTSMPKKLLAGGIGTVSGVMGIWLFYRALFGKKMDVRMVLKKDSDSLNGSDDLVLSKLYKVLRSRLMREGYYYDLGNDQNAQDLKENEELAHLVGTKFIALLTSVYQKMKDAKKRYSKRSFFSRLFGSSSFFDDEIRDQLLVLFSNVKKFVKHKRTRSKKR